MSLSFVVLIFFLFDVIIQLLKVSDSTLQYEPPPFILFLFLYLFHFVFRYYIFSIFMYLYMYFICLNVSPVSVYMYLLYLFNFYSISVTCMIHSSPSFFLAIMNATSLSLSLCVVSFLLGKLLYNTLHVHL